MPPTYEQSRAEMLKAAKQGARLMATRARMRAAVRTGDLRRSISGDARWDGDDLVIEVRAGGQGAPQARWMELGTGVNSIDPNSPKQPIVIKPVKAKALAWPKSGKFVRLSGELRTPVKKALAAGTLKAGDVFHFAQRVVQPGLKPRPYLKPAVEECLETVKTLLEKTWKTLWQ